MVSPGRDIPDNVFHVREWRCEEFRELMRGHFRHFSFFGQEARFDWAIHGELLDTDYAFIAVASNAPLPDFVHAPAWRARVGRWIANQSDLLRTSLYWIRRRLRRG